MVAQSSVRVGRVRLEGWERVRMGVRGKRECSWWGGEGKAKTAAPASRKIRKACIFR